MKIEEEKSTKRRDTITKKISPFKHAATRLTVEASELSSNRNILELEKSIKTLDRNSSSSGSIGKDSIT